MPRCATALLGLLACTLPLCAAEVTVILDFKGPVSARATGEMQREAGAILRGTGVSLSFRSRAEAAQSDFSDLVVMTFRGNCAGDPPAPRYDESGPYAVTWTTDGRVLPFGEVDCNRVIRSARSAMWGGDLARADQFYGRALGRVMAHEIVHMLTKSGDHGKSGVQREALSPRELTAATLTLSKEDQFRLQQLYTSR